MKTSIVVLNTAAVYLFLYIPHQSKYTPQNQPIMHTTTALLTLLPLFLSASALVVPRDQSQQTITNAGGAPPNGPPPSHISPSAISSFGAVNFLENLESAFFASGLSNLTHEWYSHKYDRAIEIVTKVQAQELIHVQTAENILTHFNGKTFRPCSYTFPVSTAEEFFALANVITSVGIGAVIHLAGSLALTDPSLVTGPASILAVEARHDAFFRGAGKVSRVPNPAPFDTGISGIYALNLALPFVVPGSCPDGMPDFPVIPALKQTSGSEPLTGSSGPIDFEFDPSQVKNFDSKTTYYIGWVNQANVVQYTPATVSADGKVKSTIPDGMAGLAFAALTGQNTATDVDDLTAKTVAGPAPVQIS